ncbi:flagellar biosynthesis anti-sigma factor FlgM [Thiomicrospira sp. XS5]|uniref:flagellar biosynthesis anti-sigma factor FlgM n=1 Tax=Thiomicrospira sp. XS5 TaxID=1775636 RepID=UPI000748190D|nr:flagellar biosynthesis anti-sigma factor FlgM [Thiomicrospira sp. XS5]KUJ75509.1 flagellar biosynthesis anti-sigma factor FlgM [Thiomicrospira sp. XS5]
MDIKNINQNLVNGRLNESGNGAPKNTGGQNAAQPNASTDKVTLTDVSTQMQTLEKQAAASSVDNSARIEELKAAIKEGNYQVNAENVANKLIQTEILFTGS